MALSLVAICHRLFRPFDASLAHALQPDVSVETTWAFSGGMQGYAQVQGARLRQINGSIARLQSADAVPCICRSRKGLVVHPDAAGQATCTSDNLIVLQIGSGGLGLGWTAASIEAGSSLHQGASAMPGAT